MRRKLAALVAALILVGCKDPKTPARLENGPRVAGHAVETEECVAQAFKDYRDTDKSGHQIGAEFDECIELADRKYGVKK